MFGLFGGKKENGEKDKALEEMTDEERAEFERKQEAARQRELKKAKRFFEYAEDVGTKGNYDYAIECYLNGLRLDPENMSQHENLRVIAEKRKQKGGKPAGFSDGKGMPKDTAVDKVMLAELKWAKNPDDASAAMAVMEMAIKADLSELAYWMGDFVLEANNKAKSPNKHIYLKLTDLYEAVPAYTKAVEACKLALMQDQMNMQLQKKLKDLQAEEAMHTGGYDDTDEGGFRKNLRNAGEQAALQQDNIKAKTEAQLDEAIKRTKAEWESDPENVDLLNKYTRLLLQKGTSDSEEEAIRLKTEAYDKTGQYRLKMDAGDIRIKQFTRKGRELRNKRAKAEGDDVEKINAMLQKLKDAQLKFELKEFTERVKNYPTDTKLKFHLGVRKLESGDVDGAISMFQDVQSDPKHRAQALRFLGEAFSQKKWLDEAVDTFHRAIEVHPFNDDKLALELRYHLMKVLESKAREGADIDSAQEAARLGSQIAQSDINYKDIRECVNRLRSLVDELKSGEPA